MTAVATAELIGIDPLKISDRYTAAQALGIVRDGIITGEGPTTRGRVHFPEPSTPPIPVGACAS